MKNQPVKFDITDAAITILSDKYKELTIIDTASYQVVVAGIAEIRTLRTSVEKRRKELKAESLAWGRKVDITAKAITEKLWPIEDNLKNLKRTTDDKRALIRAEKDKIEKERIETIQAKIAAFPPDLSKLPRLLKMPATEIQKLIDELLIIEINIETYQEFSQVAIKTKEEKKNLLQEYYIARITSDAEAAKQKAEAERQKQDRVEQAAKQKIEDNRLAKIREAQEAEAQKLRDAQKEIDAQTKILQDKQDHLENERLERERIEEEKQEKARIEKEVEEKAAREKTKAEEDAKQLAAGHAVKKKALRPDKKALEVYLDDLSSSIKVREAPYMKTPEGQMILSFIQTQIEKVFVDTLKKLEEM